METIRLRDNFDDIDVINTAYISYLPFKEVPDCRDYKHGERRTIVLRNKTTGALERINYVLSGGVPSMTREGCYLWYWGDIEAEGARCCLCFNYASNGKLTHIQASFCGKSPTQEEFKEATKNDSYPAAFTSKTFY